MKINRIDSWRYALLLAGFVAGQPASLAGATEYQVSTAADFQSALTAAQATGTTDTIYLTAGTYQGNFTFTGTKAKTLTISAVEGLTADQVVLDGADLGRVLDIGFSSFTGTTSDIRVRYIIFTRGLVSSSSSQAEGGGLRMKVNKSSVIG